jgi:transcriptional regulator GlxA family with amidase domain
LAIAPATYPQIDVKETMLVDRGGRLVTGGGVSLCIDTTLYLLASVLGQHVADERRASWNTSAHGRPIVTGLLRS